MDLEELSGCLMFGAVRILCHAVPRQGIHGQLIQGPTGRLHTFQTNHRRVLPWRLCRMRAGMRCPPAVTEARYPWVRGGGGEWADELAPRPPADFLVSLNVDVDGEDSHSFGHNEWEGTEVEWPAVGVSVLLVIVAFIIGVSCVARDVDDDADDVAQTWRARNKRQQSQEGVRRHRRILMETWWRSNHDQPFPVTVIKPCIQQVPHQAAFLDH